MSASLIVRIVLALVCAAGLCVVADAQSVSRPKAGAGSEIDVAGEAGALEFATSHHPELAKLLGPMKSARPKEYQRAIRELSRVSERLSRIKTRSPERHALELELWKTESRLRLVAVKTAMVDDEERREQIEALVNERNALRLRLYEFERDEAEERIAHLTKQIESLKSQEKDAVQKEVDRLVNTARSSAKRVRTKLQKAAAEDLPAAEGSKPGTASGALESAGRGRSN